MSAVELRTRILITSGLAVVFIVYFIFSYPQDAASSSWVSLAIDGILLAIGTYCAYQAIRNAWRLYSHHSAEIARPAKSTESADFRG